MTGVELESNVDGGRFVAPLPWTAFSVPAEVLLMQLAQGLCPGEELVARVEPACVEGSDEAVCFAVVSRQGKVLGSIPVGCQAVSGAVCDVWEGYLRREGRDPSETATYTLRRGLEPQPARAHGGLRVLAAPDAAPEYRFTVPAVRPLDMDRAVAVGELGHGVCERVFDARAFADMRDFFMEDLDCERMGALHGRLWLTEQDGNGLRFYTRYEAFVGFTGEGSACSVHVEAAAQAESLSQELPLAALVHSHPVMCRCERCAGEPRAEGEDDGDYGPATLSAVDIVQARRALPHAHQATFVVALPDDPEKLPRVVPYGWTASGTLRAEPGFVIAAPELPARREAAVPGMTEA